MVTLKESGILDSEGLDLVFLTQEGNLHLQSPQNRAYNYVHPERSLIARKRTQSTQETKAVLSFIPDNFKVGHVHFANHNAHIQGFVNGFPEGQVLESELVFVMYCPAHFALQQLYGLRLTRGQTLSSDHLRTIGSDLEGLVQSGFVMVYGESPRLEIAVTRSDGSKVNMLPLLNRKAGLDIAADFRRTVALETASCDIENQYEREIMKAERGSSIPMALLSPFYLFCKTDDASLVTKYFVELLSFGEHDLRLVNDNAGDNGNSRGSPRLELRAQAENHFNEGGMYIPKLALLLQWLVGKNTREGLLQPRRFETKEREPHQDSLDAGMVGNLDPNHQVNKHMRRYLRLLGFFGLLGDLPTIIPEPRGMVRGSYKTPLTMTFEDIRFRANPVPQNFYILINPRITGDSVAAGTAGSGSFEITHPVYRFPIETNMFYPPGC